MHCYILNIKAIGLMVSEDFLSFPHYKEANDRPSGHGQVEPQRALLAQFKTLLYTKYINYRPHRKDF